MFHVSVNDICYILYVVLADDKSVHSLETIRSRHNL